MFPADDDCNTLYQAFRRGASKVKRYLTTLFKYSAKSLKFFVLKTKNCECIYKNVALMFYKGM